MKKSIVVILMVFLFIFRINLSAQCEEKTSQLGWKSASQNYTEENNYNELREIHEWAIFILKRYSTVEAVITALDKKRNENEAYMIGASSIIPGVGQMINQDFLQGGLLLFSSTISWGTAQQLAFTKRKREQHLDKMPLYYGSLLLKNGIMTYAMMHASANTFERHHDKTEAIWTGMSSMVPGVGQAINEQWWEAGSLFVAWSLAAALTAHLEEKIFINGDDSYLVKNTDEPQFSFALLPNGAFLNIKKSW